MLVKFTNDKVNLFREEEIPVHQQRAHLDLPRYTYVTCANFAFLLVFLFGIVFLFCYNIFSLFLKLMSVFCSLKNGFKE